MRRMSRVAEFPRWRAGLGWALCGWALVASLSAAPCPALSARWQYCVPFDTGKIAKDGRPEPGMALLWLPPEVETLRGLLVGGQLGIELEIALDPEVRKACAESGLGIVYFSPHISSVFHYWQEGNADESRWLKAFDDLASRSGHPELKRVPWITMGHSTAGIFARNVAYRWPHRVAGILHIKSGNLPQRDHLPPGGSLAGVPLLAINGQFETYGPEGGIRPELGRETQWVFVLKNIEWMRQKDPNHLASLWLDLGGDHFHGSPELSQYAALFIRKAATYRIPPRLPPGEGEVSCIPLKLEDGWLTDPDLYNPKHPPAPFGEYTGDRRAALWHFDEQIARANARHHAKLGAHQCLSNPVCAWLDEGDGWTLRAKAEFLAAMPESYGGRVANQRIGHSNRPILYRSKINEPVEQIGPDTFRLLRPVKSVNIAAVHLGDEHFRATNRWGSLNFASVGGDAQTIEFPEIPDLPATAGPYALRAKASSGLPVYYEVDYGPVVVENGALRIVELPVRARFPMECKVTAYQIGRRVGRLVAPAAAVSREFRIVKP